MARSRSNSSELGACSHSFKLAVGNSLPMTVVTSNESNESREPLSLKGSFSRGDFTAGAVSFAIGTTGVAVLSAIEGAIGNVLCVWGCVNLWLTRSIEQYMEF